ncbi:MAG: hypothetical protein K2Q26_07040 [Bdellovibrionales bacterium]|nr:hypothetical protein [Bdellovibrionales bacterium]
MRKFLITSIISSSCLMVILGYQNCTKKSPEHHSVMPKTAALELQFRNF